jgi:hypothetical protein
MAASPAKCEAWKYAHASHSSHEQNPEKLVSTEMNAQLNAEYQS